MELARLDSPKTARPVRKPNRWGLVSRVEARGERIKRFRLERMETLPRLETLEPTARTARAAD